MNAEHLVITIVHTLPGRIRMRLSREVARPDALVRSVRGHEGLHFVAYNRVSRSVLVRHDTGAIRQEEVVLRVALAWSLDQGGRPVRVFSTPEGEVVDNLAAYAGVLVGVAGMASWLNPGALVTRRLEQAAAVGVAGAVLDHGRREVLGQGHIDPEVLTLGYLITSVARGSYLRAAAITWMTAFGRHLIDPPRNGVEVRPGAAEDGEAGECGEITVRPVMQNRAPLVALLQGMVRYAFTAGEPARGAGHFVEEFRELSKVHGEVLEGLGGMEQGIPMRIGL